MNTYDDTNDDLIMHNPEYGHFTLTRYGEGAMSDINMPSRSGVNLTQQPNSINEPKQVSIFTSLYGGERDGVKSPVRGVLGRGHKKGIPESPSLLWSLNFYYNLFRADFPFKDFVDLLLARPRWDICRIFPA